MNWLDYALIAILTLGVVFGILTGPLWQAYRIFSIIISVAAAILLNNVTSSLFSGSLDPEASGILAYVAVFVAFLILTYIIGKLLKFILLKWKFGIGGRILGGGIGFLRIILLCGAVILVVPFSGNNRAQEIVNGSLIASNLEKGARKVISTVPQNFKEKLFAGKKASVKE